MLLINYDWGDVVTVRGMLSNKRIWIVYLQYNNNYNRKDSFKLLFCNKNLILSKFMWKYFNLFHLLTLNFISSSSNKHWHTSISKMWLFFISFHNFTRYFDEFCLLDREKLSCLSYLVEIKLFRRYVIEAQTKHSKQHPK